ncbi:MAG: hypothetical protein KJP00_07770 [Bacteroidia bacterium]|nr:hypothetical protein [Bacteroidia bacterium]
MGLTYEQIKTVIDPPPSPKLLSIFNDLEKKIAQHPSCVTEEYPFEHLANIGNFCITASSIQSKYIALILGKHVETSFPTDVMQQIFNIDPSVKLQFAKIKGLEYDGCISCVHEENGFFDLQKIYDMIYLTK